MGCTGTSEEVLRDRQIQRELMMDKQRNNKFHRILLLGNHRSGRNGIFRMGYNYSDEYKLKVQQKIIEKTILKMKRLIESYLELTEEKIDQFRDLQLSSDGQKALEFIDHLHISNEMDIDNEMITNIKCLWNENGIKQAHNYGDNVMLINWQYFFDRIDIISSKNYRPSNNEIIMADLEHSKTGIIEKQFELQGHNFMFIDIENLMYDDEWALHPRNYNLPERSKFLHCFECISAIIYCANLSSFDQTKRYQDINILQESMQEFEQIANCRWFRDIPIALMFTKSDLFKVKIKQKYLNNYFIDYDGDNNYYDCIDWISEQFKQTQGRIYGDRWIQHYVVNITDTSAVLKALADISHVIVNASLQKNGLL